MSERPLVIVAEPIDPEPRSWLAERARVIDAGPGTPAFDAALPEARGLVVRTSTAVDAALLDRAPILEVVGRAGVGVDHIDLARCAERGIRVVHTPGANTEAVVELVFAFLLDAWRPRVFLESPLDAGRWSAVREELVAPRELSGSTLGVWGVGRIGSRVALAARAFGMRVLGHDLAPIDAGLGIEAASADALLAESDAVTLHVDGRASNRGMVGAAELGRMREDATLINTSRGLVLDREACAAFLRERPAARAILDVHEPEPIPGNDPLMGVHNAFMTPHIGSATAGAKRRMGWVVRDVVRVLGGEIPQHEAG